MGFENVGLVWSPDSFRSYLSSIEKPSWCKAITLHHTASPSLADRPKGLLIQHIHNLQDFYQSTSGWSAGPHLFIDEDEIFGMCDLRKKGVHAVSFNHMAIGIEVLGNYDSENPKIGRGEKCWKMAALTTRLLLDWLGLSPNENTVLFHRDDPATKKSCPGSLVYKEHVIGLIKSTVTYQLDEQSKPDVSIPWDQWKYAGNKWCVPVMAFMKANKVPADEVVKQLKSVSGLFFYGTELLEGAFYDSTNQTTWAPVNELIHFIKG